ncbi:uroporphyrinogen-III C-methyltransferase [Oscillatoria amoena NRMC-F 0135]|uniref:uroporphyrinogen-III C-methyltransferase n=1 Tax=Geitlerinema calcuttense NRMC-F 0142 TaxID=2922238 RepID=A0ABT7LW55_9CYAN|nr:uroporphyrinogen-III C-methyltransferase [Geitlerinema calcuttense]MDI9637800.1 uroporphyrinogen-III C-methyltransferase [Geitlerinema splendidum]MDL5051167.1 uroporphyrinogen-III C-methyltransferase [Oscillatoria amoena NRMC-F 0135]MDL5056257.1 uroporphyrinogen-III C-methyltransferase [Geitlerinema calcuttense NRMC-F 0142]
MTQQWGKVYLVGAGLGKVDYLTLRASQLLAQAEVLVYDALVDSQLLQLVPPSCLKFDVGKRGGKPSTPQAEINRLLVEYGQLGKQVVRLKSGDPLIFGRTHAEISSLVAAGCPYEIVPGISSALAAPLLAGIPLTDPVYSRCFAVVTGHDLEALDWPTLARLDTLAILMAGSQLSGVVSSLMQAGRSPSTPIAIIRWAGTPKQQIWTAELDNIVEQTRQFSEDSLSPAVMVIGDVVRRRGEWGMSQQNLGIETHNPTLPLAGKTILITRASGQQGEFAQLLQTQGATTLEMPTLEIGPPSSWEALDLAIAQIDRFDWLILTSSNGVDAFFERLAKHHLDFQAILGLKIAVVGQKTAASLSQRGIQADFIPPDFVADSLVAHFPESLSGLQVLFPRVETGGREVLVQEFTQQGAMVTEVPAYESRCPDRISGEVLGALQDQAIDIITFASSKTVRNFCQLIQNQDNISLEKVCFASIGPQTSKTCHQLLGRVEIEAQEYTLLGLTQALVAWIKVGKRE